MSVEATDSSILVVFCRKPVSGVGKQRIAVQLGASKTQRLAELLLAAALEDAEAWPGNVVLAPASTADTKWATRLLQRPCRVIPQSDGNLGQRINSVDRSLRRDRADSLIFIGSDAPILNEAYFARARATLMRHDVVLGPAEDGGVTLMASQTAWPDLTGLPWSTPELCGALERLCIEHGLTVHRLPVTYDIDLMSELPRLRTDLHKEQRPARRRLLKWLETTELPDIGQ